ncbi:fumarate hydratase class I, aerobic [Peptoclostridium acidaminophilum DSM 3953]|uniref:Fumarate hydratase class I, aerobic n=1 Tax=Peptoclostridium acidaminophilum DSM 3953 TaxID=1286171 RepID=W8T608_PEPAC|nr:Fe-S-containing hydro-lyase [Peptoclostridium acidaminophilum]AHM57144.1 fumarate hydratase class I, aerobic [Peptoclostridium acidaminophilum DSM 3953]
MSEVIRINAPLTKEKAMELRAGDMVLISGSIYTGRDAAHKKLMEAIANGEQLPFDPKDQIIYYVGPTPAKPGAVIGSAGPTTSSRMDKMTVPLLERGLTGMIGKGARSAEVIEGMKSSGAVYFAAVGGAGALISTCIKSSEIVAYEELGPEAIRRIYVEDFPAVVVIDSKGDSLYESERAKYSKEYAEDKPK